MNATVGQDYSQDNQDKPVNPALAPKLTDWQKEPSVQDLIADLDASRPSHDEFVLRVKKWNDLNQVKGAARPPKVKGRSQVQPKLIRRQAEWRYSALTEPFNSSEKLFDISPTTWEDANAARQNDLVLNWQFRSKINRVSFVDHYIRSSVDEGTAIVRLGWCRITKTVEEEVPVWDHYEPTTKEEVDALEIAVRLKTEDPRGYDEKMPPDMKAAVKFFEESGQPSVAQQNGTKTVKVEKVVDNRPLLNIVNPDNFYFDPSCGMDLDKAGFVIVSFETSQAELKKQPKIYKNLQYVDWEGASTVADPYHTPNSRDLNFQYKDTLRKRVVAYEYWGLADIHGTGELVPIVATWIGRTLVRLEENPFPDQKPPFVLVNYMPIKRELMGEPDAELLEDNQAILGAVARGMIDLLGRSANSQQGFAKGMLDVVNRRRFENGQDYEFNPNVNPAIGHVEHKYPEIPNSAIVMLQMQNQEAEALTGVKAFSGGLSGEAYGDVAAGIRGVLDASSKREMAILRRLASGFVQIGKKIISMNAAFLSEEEVVRVTNEEFVTVKREELATAAELDLKVDISTAEIDNNKAQDLAFMLQTMGNNMDFGITKMILMEIARLKRMPELRQQIAKFEPKPDPMQQQLLQLQIVREQKEIERLDSEVQLNQAKARKEMADANQKDLDTTEQETGTKQARAVELAGAQASANQSLEVTKALVKPRKQENGTETEPNIEAAAGWNELTKLLMDPRRRNSNNPDPANTINNREAIAENDPRFSLGSGKFEPTLDPALNPAINL